MISLIGEKKTVNNKGLTLVELLVGVVILSFGTIFISQALARISDAIYRAEDSIMAYQFATSKMAEIILDSKEKGIDADGQKEGTFQSNGKTFKWILSFQPIPGEEMLGAARLVLIWYEGDSRIENEIQTVIPVI